MLQGRLVILRPLSLDDVDREHRWINDHEVTQHLNMRYAVSRAAEEAWLRDVASKVASWGHVWFAIEIAATGQHIGNINFHEVVAEDRKARLGMMIGEKSHWSRGFGTDALMTFLRFGFEEMNLHRIDLLVDANNPRAIACYRKCGMVEEARLRQNRYARGRYVDQLVMGVLRDEWRAVYAKYGGASDA